ncbi:putative two-component system response regulator [Halanaerobium saccharolyticum]|uniref:Putative two-component system response regulator n=1 Tax=Halanaerobium saccharolyticum TaxID=43595 RepID=A0A4R6M1A7_9FIRM|nr:HD domain-containing phosphohydrolase [Halanaerobium saccharolyticum]TDO94335.1 putative two-component system response regulator [Halanaerobium saccharolyticum]
MQGLYKYLEGSSSTLDAEVYTKASMIAMSHSVEKVVKEYDLYADIYVLFQEYKFFLYERERYLELDNLCRQIFVFAKDIPDNAAQDFENTTFINLSDDSPLLKEWSVIVVHPDYSAVLATKEKPELQKINKDDYRIFKGFLSLEAEVAEDLAKYYHNLLEQQRVSYQKEDWQPEELNNKKPELKKLISLFINDSLFELEDKLRSLEEKEMRLDAMVADNKELSREIMQKLCEAGEFRDEDSLFHILRIGFTSALIFRELGAFEKEIENIFFASLLHDLGKIGIPDSILQKPGKLTAEEYEVMQNHPEIGAKILAGSHSEVLNMAYNIAYSHHEKWDGSGYPQGLKGKEIPVEARIVGLADVFDALSSKRVYKDAFSREKCVEIVSSQRNQHFQGEILDILLEHLDEVYAFRRDLKEFSEAKTTREVSDYFFSVDFSIFEFLKMREMISS